MPEVDLVYLWVDGNDPEWQAKKNATIGASDNSTLNCKGRYADNDELKYSLRSVEKYAPWIRKIFIVTDNQVPKWLDTSNPKIQIVDHKEILPPESLPCFNSSLLEQFIFKIPGLSEHFIYANDDMMLNRPVEFSTFFAPDGLPYIRFSYRRPLRKLEIWYKTKVKHRKLNRYNMVIEKSARLVERQYGKYYGYKGHHNIDAYLKSDYQLTNETFAADIQPMLEHHSRTTNDVQRHLYSYAPLARGRAHKVFVGRKTSFHIWNHREDHYAKFMKKNPIFFCINDSEFSTDAHRAMAKEFLSKLFPTPSKFEK